MNNTTSDRNLVFGLLALQMSFVTRDELLDAMQMWAFNKQRPLSELMVELKLLQPQHRELLEPLVAAHIQQHGNDPQQSLAAISSVEDVVASLRKLNDADLNASLRHVADRRSARAFGPSPSVGDNESTINGPPPDSQEATLRYRVLRPHAKGGLGEVFVARDTELNREVALKEIQTRFADELDSRSRFRLEAEITGNLEHPGIVPVYGLGQYADGRPFYAMRFIRGDSLKEAIERFHNSPVTQRSPVAPRQESNALEDAPEPTGKRLAERGVYDTDRGVEFRKLLGRFIDVCNAIEYAHSRGVLHRDLKPGNVVLGKYGETLVVDWGLAKALGRTDHTDMTVPPVQPSSGSGSAPTMMGSAIGTPAYMSPEQAAGRLNELGPASDVYSLGATLYHVLTGQPAFTGRDLGDILRRVQAGDFPRPRTVARSLRERNLDSRSELSKLDIPLPLEAICLKAMSLRPSDRYASPLALADDIERWLADEPVAVYREPLPVRARRFVRRHRVAVTSLSAAVVVGVVGLTAMLIVRMNAQRDRLELDKEHANALTSKNRDLEAANKRERAATSTARDQTQLALKSLDSVIFEIQRKLTNVPGAGKVQREVLLTALHRLQEVSDEFTIRGAKDRSTLVSLQDLGDVFLRIGSASPLLGSGSGSGNERPFGDLDGPLTAARKAYRQSFDIAQHLALVNPNDRRAQRDLSVSYNRLGDVRSKSGEKVEALESYQRGHDIRHKLAADDPNDAEAQRDLSVSDDYVGIMLLQSAKLTEALGSFQQGLEIRQKLAVADPNNTQAQRDLSISFGNIGDVLLRSGKVAEALEAYQKKMEISQKLAEADPSDAKIQRDLSFSYDNLGEAQLDSEKVTDALRSFQKGLEIRQQLAVAEPGDFQAQRDLYLSHIRLGDVLLDSGRVPEALESLKQGLEISQKLAQVDLTNVQAQRDQFVSIMKLGGALLQSDLVAEALASYQQGLEIHRKMSAADPANAEAQRDLAVIYMKVGDVQLESKQLTEARESYQQSLEIRKNLATQADPANVLAQHDLATSFDRLGDVLLKLQQMIEALGYYQQALEIRQKIEEANPNNVEALHALATSYSKLGDVCLKSGQFRDATEHFQRCSEIILKQAATDMANAKLQLDLVQIYQAMGNIHRKQKHYEQAIESYRRVLDVLQSLKEQERLPPSNEKWIPGVAYTIQQCQREALAIGDWKILLEQPTELVPELLAMRGIEFVREGRINDAAQAAAKLRQLPEATAGDLYDAACVYSLCAAGIKAEKNELTAEQAAERKKHIADALVTLREAIKAGYKDFAHMQKDADLAILRDLPEFKALFPKE